MKPDVSNALEQRRERIRRLTSETIGTPEFSYYIGYEFGFDNRSTNPVSKQQFFMACREPEECQMGYDDGVGDREMLLNE